MKTSLQRNGLRLAFALLSAQIPAIAAWSDENILQENATLVSESPIRTAETSTVMADRSVPLTEMTPEMPGVPANAGVRDAVNGQGAWWTEQVSQPLLPGQRWIAFDLPTVLVDTLVHSPRIESVKSAASVQFEEIIQQDAAFDSRVVLEGGYGLTNDPVGNTLVTGGPPRLRERSFTFNGGLRRNTRGGATVDLSQELGLLSSNSQFFSPADQGNSRLNLSLTQPLMAGRGRVVNERLLVQARIDGRISWQEMRTEVTELLAEVMSVYLQLHERRCHLVQQNALIERGSQIEGIVVGRQELDVGRLGIVKLQQRRSLRENRLVQDTATIKRLQTQLKVLVGSETLASTTQTTEMIPSSMMDLPMVTIELADALRTGMENRPDVKAALNELESAALGIRVTKNQLLPRLDAVLNGYLAGLNGRNQVFQSFGDQFYESGPGISALLQYEMPRGNRNARSRHRAAMFQYRQASAKLQEVVQQIQLEVETALTRLEAADTLRRRQRDTLQLSTEEELILTERYALLGPDGGRAGVVLDSLMDAQQRRTDAERSLVTAQTEYQLSLIDLQRAMGTLLTNEGIQPVRANRSNEIDWVSDPSFANEMVFQEQSVDEGGDVEREKRTRSIDVDGLEMIENETLSREPLGAIYEVAPTIVAPVVAEEFTR